MSGDGGDAPSATFVTTASTKVGLGHLRRCLNLLDGLRGQGFRCRFNFCTGDAETRLVPQGVAWTKYPSLNEAIADALGDVIVVDSYDLAATHLELARDVAEIVVVFDDLAAIELAPDILVNGAAGADQLGYRLGPRTEALLGPSYAVLRPELAGDTSISNRERVLVTLGGGGESELVERQLMLASEIVAATDGIAVDIVLGPLADTEALPIDLSSRISCHSAPPDFVRMLRSALVVVCSGGQTSYEALAAGAPTVVVLVAENQRSSFTALASTGAVELGGELWSPGVGRHVGRTVAHLVADARRREDLARRGRMTVDGGGARRVAERIRIALMDRR